MVSPKGMKTKKVYGHKPDYALELTEYGIKQANGAGKELKRIIGEEKVMFYVSPMFRTRRTFECLLRSFELGKVRYKEEPRIREQEWGHLKSEAECDRIDRERDAYGTFYYRIPDGESAADVYDRVSDFFATLHRDFEKPDFPENVVIVTHGMTIRLFLMRWFHWEVDFFERLKNPENCQMIEMKKTESEKYKLLSPLLSVPPKHLYQQAIRMPISEADFQKAKLILDSKKTKDQLPNEKINISTYWSGYCPACAIGSEHEKMRLNTDDFFECEKCKLQIVLSAPNVLATILNFRGKGKFRHTLEYAHDRWPNEILCRQTMEDYPFTDNDIFRVGKEIEEYVFTLPA